MIIAVFINTFHGLNKPYGIFSSFAEADNWIRDVGLKKPNRENRSLWTIMEVEIVT